MSDSQNVSAQLRSELRASLSEKSNSRRPVLHHLNADLSWLLQLPRPTDGRERERNSTASTKLQSRIYYNILIDPWLAGGQSDIASWFSLQFHATPGAYGSIAAIEALARESENVTCEEPERTQAESAREDDIIDADVETRSYIDAVAISHEFTDHCHKQTLLQIDRDVPVFAIRAAADLIKGWKHFRKVTVIPAFGSKPHEMSDWRDTRSHPLPCWVGIGRLVQTDDVRNNLHAALIITFKLSGPEVLNGNTSSTSSENGTDEDDDFSTEAVIYSPHGVHASDFVSLQAAQPPIYTLALLHGLHDVRVGTESRTALQTNHGAHNGLAVQRVVNAKYWISTHDEVKTSAGLVSWFLQRKVIGVQEAVEAEQRVMKQGDADEWSIDNDDAFNGVNWLEMVNGESRVLM